MSNLRSGPETGAPGAEGRASFHANQWLGMTKRPWPLFRRGYPSQPAKIFHRPNPRHELIRVRPDCKHEPARRVVPSSNLGNWCLYPAKTWRHDRVGTTVSLNNGKQIWKMLSSLTNIFR